MLNPKGWSLGAVFAGILCVVAADQAAAVAAEVPVVELDGLPMTVSPMQVDAINALREAGGLPAIAPSQLDMASLGADGLAGLRATALVAAAFQSAPVSPLSPNILEARGAVRGALDRAPEGARRDNLERLAAAMRTIDSAERPGVDDAMSLVRTLDSLYLGTAAHGAAEAAVAGAARSDSAASLPESGPAAVVARAKVAENHGWRDRFAAIEVRFPTGTPDVSALEMARRAGLLPNRYTTVALDKTNGFSDDWTIAVRGDRLLSVSKYMRQPRRVLRWDKLDSRFTLLVYEDADKISIKRMGALAVASVRIPGVEIAVSSRLHAYLAAQVPAPDLSEDPARYAGQVKDKIHWHVQELPGGAQHWDPVFVEFSGERTKVWNEAVGLAIMRRHGFEATRLPLHTSRRGRDAGAPLAIRDTGGKSPVLVALALAREPMVTKVWLKKTHEEELAGILGKPTGLKAATRPGSTLSRASWLAAVPAPALAQIGAAAHLSGGLSPASANVLVALAFTLAAFAGSGRWQLTRRQTLGALAGFAALTGLLLWPVTAAWMAIVPVTGLAAGGVAAFMRTTGLFDQNDKGYVLRALAAMAAIDIVFPFWGASGPGGLGVLAAGLASGFVVASETLGRKPGNPGFSRALLDIGFSSVVGWFQGLTFPVWGGIQIADAISRRTK